MEKLIEKDNGLARVDGVPGEEDAAEKMMAAEGWTLFVVHYFDAKGQDAQVSHGKPVSFEMTFRKKPSLAWLKANCKFS